MRKIEELLNKEMSFVELDNIMTENGYYSILNDGVIEDIKRDRCAIYTGVESGECEVVVTFEITIDNGEDEGLESFYLKVTNVEKF